ncbi:MAG: putative arabinose efflux permease, MFS family [Sporanaerobacter sp.]|jgi:MFS family permease|uniref:MFS transporter n=1 Tax=Sporanaerobacter sp. TaxID=2010183 RepID=UPI003A0FE47D
MDLFLIFLTGFLIHIIISMEFNLISAIAPYLASFFNIKASSVITLNLGFSIVGLLIPLLGTWADKYGKKKYIFTSLIFFVLGAFISGISHSPSLFAIGRTFIGIGYFSLNASVISYISDFVPYEKRGKASGILRIAFGLALLTSPLYATFMIKSFDNLKGIYIPFAIVGIICLFLLIKLPESEKVNNEKIDSNDVLNILKDPVGLKLLIIQFLTVTAPFTIYSYLGIWLSKDFSLNQLQIGYVYTAAACGTVLGITMSTFAADKIGKQKFTKIFYTIMILALSLMPYSKSLYLTIALIFTFAFGLDGGWTAYQAICTEIYPEKRTTFMTLLFFTNAMMITLFTLIGPLLYNLGGYKLIASIASVSSIVALFLFFNVSKSLD